MFSRLFSCFNRKKNNSSETNPMLADQGSVPAIVAAHPDRSSCDSSRFWMGSEFVYNFAKVLTLSTYAIATQITDFARLKSDFDSIELSKTALYISTPIAVLFAASEAACHYAESRLISTNNENIDNNQQELPAPPLRTWQIALIALHLLSDVYDNVGSYLAIAEIIGLKQQSDELRYGLYAGLTVVSLWGNMQEARNARESFREMNTAALRANRSAV